MTAFYHLIDIGYSSFLFRYPNRFGKREQMALQTDNDFKLEISTAKSPYELGEEEKKLLEEDRKDE